MIDIKKCEFEDLATVEDSELYYFRYPYEELFKGDLKELFRTEEEYAREYGPVVGACLCVEIVKERGKLAWLSPTCAVDDGLEDVDHVCIELDDTDLTSLVLIGQNGVLKARIKASFDKLAETMNKMKETLNRLKDVAEETK